VLPVVGVPTSTKRGPEEGAGYVRTTQAGKFIVHVKVSLQLVVPSEIIPEKEVVAAFNDEAVERSPFKFNVLSAPGAKDTDSLLRRIARRISSGAGGATESEGEGEGEGEAVDLSIGSCALVFKTGSSVWLQYTPSPLSSERQMSGDLDLRTAKKRWSKGQSVHDESGDKQDVHIGSDPIGCPQLFSAVSGVLPRPAGSGGTVDPPCLVSVDEVLQAYNADVRQSANATIPATATATVNVQGNKQAFLHRTVFDSRALAFQMLTTIHCRHDRADPRHQYPQQHPHPHPHQHPHLLQQAEEGANTTWSMRFVEVIPDIYDIDLKKYTYSVQAPLGASEDPLLHAVEEGYVANLPGFYASNRDCSTLATIRDPLGQSDSERSKNACFRTVGYDVPALPPGARFVSLFEGRKRLLDREHQPIDASRGYLVPGSLLFVRRERHGKLKRQGKEVDGEEEVAEVEVEMQGGSCSSLPTCEGMPTKMPGRSRGVSDYEAIYAYRHGYGHEYEYAYTAPLLLTAPIPDSSMPYNVITLVRFAKEIMCACMLCKCVFVLSCAPRSRCMFPCLVGYPDELYFFVFHIAYVNVSVLFLPFLSFALIRLFTCRLVHCWHSSWVP
jgi:hypothetical protein